MTPFPLSPALSKINVVASKSNVPAFIVSAVPTLLRKFDESPCKLKSPLPLRNIPSEERLVGNVPPKAILPPFKPLSFTPPSVSESCPKLIDACVEEIATSVASNSNLSV